MDWLAWEGWSDPQWWAVFFTALAAIIALVLGIRAEIRGAYSKAWSVSGRGDSVTVVNRTGEDASDVTIRVVADGFKHEQIDLVRRDEEVSVAVPLPRGIEGDTRFRVAVTVTWIRSRNGWRYSKRAGHATLQSPHGMIWFG